MPRPDSTNDIDRDRRQLLGAAALALASGKLDLSAITRPIARGVAPPLGPIKQIDAGVLSVGYAEAGRPDGRPVFLLHGWPYDINSFAEVMPLLGEMMTILRATRAYEANIKAINAAKAMAQHALDIGGSK